jgi:hypothetical protein
MRGGRSCSWCYRGCGTGDVNDLTSIKFTSIGQAVGNPQLVSGQAIDAADGSQRFARLDSVRYPFYGRRTDDGGRARRRWNRGFAGCW